MAMKNLKDTTDNLLIVEDMKRLIIVALSIILERSHHDEKDLKKTVEHSL